MLALFFTNPNRLTKENFSSQEESSIRDVGLKKAVEDSKIPFDSKLDVLVKYAGKKGKGLSLMFVMELNCFKKHILNQQVTFTLAKGWVHILKEDLPLNGLHRLVLGLEKESRKTSYRWYPRQKRQSKT